MIKLNIKPLSVNKAWQGKRFKTPLYKAYEKKMMLILPKSIGKIPDQIEVNITFGFSNKASDIDNGVKPFLDLLQKKYRFNDSQIYRLNIHKVLTEKGFDFIEFEIKNYNQ
jgi:Holliday junction resolvase RusA-like endonuclease